MKRLRSLTAPDASVEPSATRRNPCGRKSKPRKPRRPRGDAGWIA